MCLCVLSHSGSTECLFTWTYLPVSSPCVTPKNLKGFPQSTSTGVWAAKDQSVQRLATGWTVRGSNPGGGKIFRTRPDRPWDPPSLLYNGNQVSLPGVKRSGRGVNHPPHLAPRLKKKYSYLPPPPVGLHGLFQGKFYLYLLRQLEYQT